MTQERLNGLAVLSFEKEKASVIGSNEFIAEFATVKSMNVDFFVGSAIVVRESYIKMCLSDINLL
jgi:hypothetical protein